MSPSFGEATRVWALVAAQSFGGPAGQIAVMHRVLVEERRWIGEERFLHALNFCMLLPGPEAQQLATYLGWLMHGVRGGLVAGGLFVLPGFVSILGLSVLYASYASVAAVGAVFWGLKAAVLAVVLEAAQRIGKRVLGQPGRPAIALAAFVAIFFFGLPFPIIVVAAGLWGWLGGRRAPPAATAAGGGALDVLLDGEAPAHTRPSLRRAVGTAALWLSLWWVPVLALGLGLGWKSTFAQVGLFFSKTAVVTFGGAYAVLAYIGQQAVERYGWLAPGEMLDGLGLAETTPGPLIQVVQFVGFLATWRDPGGLSPLVAGVLGSMLTTWVTFTPCFLWIFVGAPYVERLRGQAGLSAALGAITAAVVGVIANLALWLALHVLFGQLDAVEGPLGLRLLVPELGTVDWAAVVVFVAAALALLRFHVGMLPVLAGAGLAGLALRLGGLA